MNTPYYQNITQLYQPKIDQTSIGQQVTTSLVVFFPIYHLSLYFFGGALCTYPLNTSNLDFLYKLAVSSDIPCHVPLSPINVSPCWKCMYLPNWIRNLKPSIPMMNPCMLYMVTWIPSIYPIHVSIYSSTMDSMGYKWWLYRSSLGHFMGISWGFHGDFMGISWGFHGDFMDPIWDFPIFPGFNMKSLQKIAPNQNPPRQYHVADVAARWSRGRSRLIPAKSVEMIYPLVMTNIAMEIRWPMEIDGLPIKHGDFP